MGSIRTCDRKRFSLASNAPMAAKSEAWVSCPIRRTQYPEGRKRWKYAMGRTRCENAEKNPATLVFAKDPAEQEDLEGRVQDGWTRHRTIWQKCHEPNDDSLKYSCLRWFSYSLWKELCIFIKWNKKWFDINICSLQRTMKIAKLQHQRGRKCRLSL